MTTMVTLPDVLSNHSLSSFLASLVQANLALVLEQEEMRTQLVTSLRPSIERSAYRLYYRVRFHVSIDPDDLIQEAMLAAWAATARLDTAKMKDSSSLTGFLMKRARGAMFNALTRINKTPAMSLDEYLETDDQQDGPWTHEIADSPTPYHQTSYRERRRILAALRQLSENERLIVMAVYRIEEGHDQRVREVDNVKKRLRLTDSGFYSAKARALRKLADLLEEVR